MTIPELFGDPDQWPDDDLIMITGALSPHLVLAALHEGCLLYTSDAADDVYQV